MTKVKVVICPYCGETQPAGERCRTCSGLFEPLSRQATHNAMGPWYVRNPERPFQPGASYETLVKLIERGQVTKYTVLRGPTTRQFWTIARHTPGVAHLLGYCHQCDASVNPKDLGCPKCGAPFGAYLDRNHLGLPDVKAMPWETDAEVEDASQSVYGSLLDPHPLRPQATGLSSFASDDEITHGSEAPSRYRVDREPSGWGEDDLNDTGFSPGRGESTRSTAQVATATLGTPGASPVFDPREAYATAAHRRALQRRLSRMRNMNIALFVLVMVMGLFGLGAVLGWFSPDHSVPVDSQQSDLGADGGVGIDARVPLGNDSSTRAESESDQNGGPERDERRGDGLNDRIEPPSEENAQDQASSNQLNPWKDQFVRAQILIEQSNDESLTLDARIDAIQEAITLLKDIELRAPAELQPDNLPEEIARRERQWRKLEVLKYFPD